MKTLIYGAGPIGQWLALALKSNSHDLSVLARGKTYERLMRSGIQIIDGLNGEKRQANVDVVTELARDQHYDLVIVPMGRASRVVACSILGEHPNIETVMFVGNDVEGPNRYFQSLRKDQILLGFPGAGGGWQGEDLIIADRDKIDGRPKFFFGELDGQTRSRTLKVQTLFQESGVEVSLEQEMDGWLKYHFAFVGPMAGAIFDHGGKMTAVVQDEAAIHQFCRACRQAGNVLRELGYYRRQPPIFNLFYWLPRWLEVPVFSKLFDSELSSIRFGLHAASPNARYEVRALARAFRSLIKQSSVPTPDLDLMLRHILATENVDEPLLVSSSLQ